MRSRIRSAAHILERVGLGLAGATCGLLVAVQVGSSIDALASEGFLIAMMVAGAIGFYLGIDTPPLEFEGATGPLAPKVDAAEFLTAAGTFLATLSALVAIGVIAIREMPHFSWNMLMLMGWVAGIAMQIVAGAIARTRR
jgi:hypothetical protein